MAKPTTPKERCAAAIVETVPLVMHALRLELSGHGTDVATIPQVRMMALIEREPHLPLNRVAEVLAITQASASTMVERLVQRGLVHRETDERERRRIRLSLTVEGKAELRRRRRVAARLIQDYVAALDDAKLEALTESLASLRELFARPAEFPPEENEA